MHDSNNLGHFYYISYLFLVGNVISQFVKKLQLNKQTKEYEKLHRDLAVGQQILFDGIYGKLIRVGDVTCDVQIKSGAILQISRFAISKIIS